MKEAALGRPLQRARITAFCMSTIESGWRYNILAFASHKLLCSIRKYVSHFHLQNLDTELMDGVLPRQHIVTKRHFLRILHYKGTLKSCCCCHFSRPQIGHKNSSSPPPTPTTTSRESETKTQQDTQRRTRTQHNRSSDDSDWWKQQQAQGPGRVQASHPNPNPNPKTGFTKTLKTKKRRTTQECGKLIHVTHSHTLFAFCSNRYLAMKCVEIKLQNSCYLVYCQ
jgi:hypothetical protein